jgi:hypothetical protein
VVAGGGTSKFPLEAEISKFGLEACNNLIGRKVSMCDGEKLSKQKKQMASHLGRRTGVSLL